MIEYKTDEKHEPTKGFKCECLICSKKLESESFGPNAWSWPIVYGGVVFRTTGQYGTSVWDGAARSANELEANIQIIICDECLKKKADIVNAFTNSGTAKEIRPFAEVAVEYAEYTTLEEKNEK